MYAHEHTQAHARKHTHTHTHTHTHAHLYRTCLQHLQNYLPASCHLAEIAKWVVCWHSDSMCCPEQLSGNFPPRPPPQCRPHHLEKQKGSVTWAVWPLVHTIPGRPVGDTKTLEEHYWNTCLQMGHATKRSWQEEKSVEHKRVTDTKLGTNSTKSQIAPVIPVTVPLISHLNVNGSPSADPYRGWTMNAYLPVCSIFIISIYHWMNSQKLQIHLLFSFFFKNVTVGSCSSVLFILLQHEFCDAVFISDETRRGHAERIFLF